MTQQPAESCHENWDLMTPTAQGRFCGSCQKQVLDFSTKSLDEIKSFFGKLPETEQVCGRFKDEQMKELTFDAFFRQFSRWRFLHKIAVICFFVFGLSLFSFTARAQQPLMPDSLRTALQKQLPADTSQKKPVFALQKDSVFANRLNIDSLTLFVKPQPEVYWQGAVSPIVVTNFRVPWDSFNLALSPYAVIENGKELIKPSPLPNAEKGLTFPVYETYLPWTYEPGRRRLPVPFVTKKPAANPKHTNK